MKPTALYADIALPLPIPGTFTYAIPDELADDAEPGIRAVVPFGKRVLTGFIMRVGATPPDIPLKKLRRIISLLDEEPVVSPDMMELAAWMAEYYVAGVGEVLKSASPPATEVISRTRLHARSDVPVPDDLTDFQRSVLDAIHTHDGITPRSLERSLGRPVAALVRALEVKGLVSVRRETDRGRMKPKMVRYIVPGDAPVGVLPSRAREQKRCATAVSGHPEGIELAEFLERYSFTRGVVNAVVDAGCAGYDDRETLRLSRMFDQEHLYVDHPLTGGQQLCVDGIFAEADAKKPLPILLKGVTGSGKTRIYIEITREMRARGKGAIILVPEIALTPQTVRFFSSVFPGDVAVLHSALTPGERYDMWRLIHAGERRIVIGPRSAVFAPVPDLGLIVVDEEHDGSYKQADTAPRYHARDVAVMRGMLARIPVVLGSATPSLESWYNADRGKYRLCTLASRIMERPLPEIVSIDMRIERSEGNQSSLSRRLRDELAARVEQGEKSIVLINRRGFATSVQCRTCGEALMCPYCAAALTYHSSKRLAVCHICGHKQIVLEHCPACGANDLAYRGGGTQRIEQELAAIVGPQGVVRMDSDTTRGHDAHHRLIEEFRGGPAPVLLGTQMVAKGFDFPEVTLVGIISADSALYVPDFRAAEQTFQLITQVAGRAGRGMQPGIVVLQTFNPDNYAIMAATTHDYDAFASQELAIRNDVQFPPFARLLLIELQSEDESALAVTARMLVERLGTALPDDVAVLGPTEPPIARKRGRKRLHILIKTVNAPATGRIVRRLVEPEGYGRVSVSIDVDPADLV